LKINAEGVVELQPRATPWDQNVEDKKLTLKEFANVSMTTRVLFVMNNVRTLSEF